MYRLFFRWGDWIGDVSVVLKNKMVGSGQCILANTIHADLFDFAMKASFGFYSFFWQQNHTN